MKKCIATILITLCVMSVSAQSSVIWKNGKVIALTDRPDSVVISPEGINHNINSFSIKTQTYAAIGETVEIRLEGINSSNHVTIGFGDGSSDEGLPGRVFRHKYSIPGVHTIIVNCGNSIATASIEISPLKALSSMLTDLRDHKYINKVLVMAHRSHVSDKNYPENSLSSVAAAIAEGADILEFDVHATKDDSLVVCHNTSIDATTTGSGEIADLSYKQIQLYTLRNRLGQATKEKMPTLREFMLAARGKAYVNIDMGTTSAQHIIKVVKELGMMEQTLFTTSISQVAAVSLHAPKAHFHMWQNDYKNVSQYLKYPPYTTQYHCKPGYWITERDTAVEDGNVIVVNILNTTFPDLVPEFEVRKDQIDYLLKNCPEVSIIHTDCPKELRAELKLRRLHD